jgi:cardiolipin synthase
MKDNWRDGNSIELLINGEEFYPKVFESIRNAESEVLLETFILSEDEVGKELQKALIEAAKKGARVDVTVDDYGTADLSEEFIQELTQAGVNLHVFDPTPRLIGIRVNMFRRLHRKLVVVDAKEAFVGGINFSIDHITAVGPYTKQDYAVLVRGPIVQDVRKTCLHLLKHGRKTKPLVDTSPVPSTEKPGSVRMLLAVRDNIWHTKDIERHYLRAIHGAKERLLIANAYFFPGYRLLRALRRAARRGVKVTLILQGKPDMPWVSVCSRLLYQYLLRDKVEIYEYCQRPLHGKVAVADDKWATVGSSNLDPLSLALNLEANLVIEDKEFNQKLFNHLTSLAKSHCKPVDVKVIRHGYWWRLPFIFLSFHFLRIFPVVAGWFPAHKPDIQLLGSEEAVDLEKNNIKQWPKKNTHDMEKLS